MGGSSSQVVGYKYYAGLMVALGNRIEKLIAIRPDNRKWIAINSTINEAVVINEPNLFGGDKGEGGFQGVIDVHLGADDQPQNPYLALKDSPIVSAYPNLSYLVYRGASGDKGFHLVSMSGMLKEVLYWVKRIHVKNDGSPQWYDEKSEIENLTHIETGDNLITGSFYLQKVSNIKQKGQPEQNIIDNSSIIYNNGFINPSIYNALGFSYESSSVNGDGPHEISVYIDVSGINGLSFVDYEIKKLSENLDKYWLDGVVVLSDKFIGSYVVNNGDGTETIVSNYRALINVSNSTKIGLGVIFSGGKLMNSGLLSIFASIDISFGALSTQADYYIESGDINPVNKIREILTDYTAMNKPESDVNDTNFMAAADRIWDEGLGISWAIQEKSCKEAIDELLYHIEAGIRVNRQTGKYEIILFRDDLLDLDNAMSFDESNIQDLDMEIATTDDLINVLNVSYYDRENITDSSFSVYENGNIRTLDQEIAESANFPYFMNRKNAELVANWKLKQLSTPTWKGSFTTGVYDARKLNRYDVIKLTWDNLGIVNLPVRVMKISLGDGIDNTVSIDFVEVIPYSSIDYQPVAVDPPTSAILPPQPNNSIAFEMPYYEAVQNFGQTQVDAELANNPDLGYVAVASKKPQNNSLNALLYTDVGTGYTQQSIVNYCPNAQLDQAIGYLDTSFAIKNIDSLSVVAIGSTFICGSEIMVYESFDINTSIITVKRGALDTVPAQHAIDSVIWFYDEYPNYDTTQYVDGEIVNAKVLTTTPSGFQELSDVTALSVEMDARPIRPYPPANVKINGQYYLSQAIGGFTLTWVDRNRLQQTGGAILGWTDATVTAESGLTYHLELHNLDTSTDTFNLDIGLVNTYSFSALSPANYRIRLYSVRDSYSSYQMFEHNIQVITNDKLLQEDGTSYLLLESGDFILLEQ